MVVVVVVVTIVVGGGVVVDVVGGGGVVVVVGGSVVVVVPTVVVVVFAVVVVGVVVVGTVVVIGVVDLVIKMGASTRFSAGVPVRYVVSFGVTTTNLVDSGSGVEVRELRSANSLPIVRCCNDCSSDICSSTLTGSMDVLTGASGRDVVVLLVLVLRGVVDFVTLDTDLVGVGVGEGVIVFK